MIIHDIDKIFFDSESGWVREKCTECGVAKVFSSDGYAVCSCLEPVKVQRSILMDDTIIYFYDTIIYFDENGVPWTLEEMIRNEA